MKRIEASGPIELTLVLEIEPYHWSDRALPQGPSRDHPEAWYTYFHQCMADAGITGIDPIRPGSHFVDAFSVVDNELIVRLIREELEESGLPGFPDDTGCQDAEDVEAVGMLTGGYALCSGHEVFLEPECCCDFSNLESWRQALAEQPVSGTLWIGHPQAGIAFERDTVTITQGWEGGPAPACLAEIALRVAALREAVVRAEDARKELARRLLPRVQEVMADPDRVREVRDRLMADDLG